MTQNPSKDYEATGSHQRSSEGSQSRDQFQDQFGAGFTQVRDEITQLIGNFDTQQITQRIEEFGREKPVALAAGAFAIGLFAGILMRGRAGSTQPQ